MAMSEYDLNRLEKDKTLRSNRDTTLTKQPEKSRVDTHANNFCSRWYVMTEIIFGRLGVR